MSASRLLVIVLLLTVVPAALPAGAQAITGATLTADPLGLLDETLPPNDPATLMHVSGATTGPLQLNVPIGCAWEDATGSISPGNIGTLNLAGDGTFSGDLRKPGADSCLITVLPTVSPQLSDFAGYSGTLNRGTSLRLVKIPSGPNAGQVTEADVGLGSASALVALSDPERGTPSSMAPVTQPGPLPRHQNELWADGDMLVAKTGSSRAALQVDGTDALSATEVAASNPSATGLLPMTVTQVTDTGSDIAATFTLPFLRCPSSCQDAGIQLERTASTSGAARVVHVRDVWRNTSGQSHAIDVQEVEAVDADGPDFQNGFAFPWLGAAYGTHTAGDQIPLPPGQVNTIYVQRTPGGMNDTLGSLTLSARPDSMVFTGGNELRLGFRRTIPAGGTFAVDRTYSAAMTAGEVSDAAAAAEAASAGGPGTSPPAATAPTPPAPTTTPTPAARLTFGAEPRFRNGVLTLSVGCSGRPGQTCAISALLTASARKPRTATRKRRATTVTLLKRTLAVPAGPSRAVKLRLSRTAARMIPKHGTLAARLTLSPGAGAVGTTKRYPIALRR